MSKIDTRYNQYNEIMKSKFLRELTYSGVNGKDPRDSKTILQYVKAIHEFEVATNFKDFKKFTQELAILFKNHLSDKKNKRTGENISKSLFVHYLKYTKEFFEWLIINEKEYSHIKQTDINFLKTTKNDRNIALSIKEQESYLVSEILSTIRKMPSETPIEMRNKAMISLCLLTTPRISSLQTARICSIRYFRDYEVWAFAQDLKLVDTKFARTITSFFIGKCQDIIDNVLNWQNYLREQGFKDKDYLFPKIVQVLRVKANIFCNSRKIPLNPIHGFVRAFLKKHLLRMVYRIENLIYSVNQLQGLQKEKQMVLFFQLH